MKKKKKKKLLKKKKNLKIIAPTWHDEFELPGGSHSVSKDYIELIIRKIEILANNPPIYICINMVNNRLVIKKKDGYKTKLQTSATLTLFCTTKKNNRQNKQW